MSGGVLRETEREFRRRMARFELVKARRLADSGNADRAAAALRRARLWRWDALIQTKPAAQGAAA